jgi:DNA-binding helix-hairpin-helix protein with protein kinase domain
MLSPHKDRVNRASGGAVRVGAELGTGGQGTVYEGTTDDGRKVAIKWYLPAFQNRGLRESIGELVAKKAPSRHFLWPDDLVVNGDEFGYIMRLRPPEFANLTAVLKRRVKLTFRELVVAASQTVSAFKELQATGLFYRDISDGNLFLNPRTGDVLICDNDNVGSSRTPNTVLGTARYMAPEIVRGEKGPSALTDSFSMAVLLFLLLMNDHPLQGAKESQIHVFDAAAMRRIYGTSPVFIFDPVDASNRPVPGLHLNAPLFWQIYPKPIRDIFTRVFTEGLHEQGKRPSFGEWQAALAAAEDAIVVCQCGRQNFVDDGPVRCWGCKRAVALPMRLVVGGRRTVMLNTDTVLYDRHITGKGGSAASPGDKRAEVTRHPTQNVLGLKNMSPGQWFVQVPGKPSRAVEPGSSVRLAAGTEISFGDGSGVIQE